MFDILQSGSFKMDTFDKPLDVYGVPSFGQPPVRLSHAHYRP